MGIPERVFVQCLSQGTTSGVVAFAVIVVVVVVVVVAAVVVVVDHVVVVLGARYIANEHETDYFGPILIRLWGICGRLRC